MIPFETNALEINRTSLENYEQSEVPEKSEDYVDQSPNAESYKTPKIEEQHSGPMGAQEQIKEEVEEIEESVDNSAYEGTAKGVMINENDEEGNSKTEKLVDNVESVPALDQNMKQAEKGDTGILDNHEEGNYEDESSNTEQKILQGNMAQRKHSLADSERLSHKIEGRMDGSSRKGQEGEASAEDTLARPKNVICNAAGCFSSLEELDMFNELASQVRNSLEEFDKIESAAVHDQGKDADASLKHSDDGNSEPESSEQKANLR